MNKISIIGAGDVGALCVQRSADRGYAKRTVSLCLMYNTYSYGHLLPGRERRSKKHDERD